MNFEKEFSIETQKEDSSVDEKIINGEEVKRRVLEITNDETKLVQAPKINSQSPLHKRLHQERTPKDTTHEVEDFEKPRKEILESFGIPDDEDHTIILSGDEDKLPDGTQRDFRAFSIIFDEKADEQIYAEGRTWHKHLNELIAQRLSEILDQKVRLNDIKDEINERYITIKGFLSDDEFAELEDNFRDHQSFAFETEDGTICRTPAGWFISGSSLSS